ncbi:hypothetical protein JCM21900_004901 [Sporobolomyces salmonicolor]
MDAFRTLTGGSRFDRTRFKADIRHFQPQLDPIASTSTAAPATALPSELDFFGATSPVGDSRAAATDKDERKDKKKQRKRKRTEGEAEAAAGAAGASEAAQVDHAALLRKHRIKLTGLDCPNPLPSVEAVAQYVLKDQAGEADKAALQRLVDNWKRMGMKDPTGVQMASWGTMLANRDILACAPTGSGKTFSFVLPLLAMHPPSASSDSDSTSTSDSTTLRPKAVIIEPTRELAMQVLRETRRLADGGEWRVGVLGEEGVGMVKNEKGKKGKGNNAKKGKKGKGKKEEVAGAEVKAAVKEDDIADKAEPTDEKEVAKMEEDAAAPYLGPLDILITTPLRLIFALKSSTVSLSSTTHLILDEADKLFELNFLEQTDEILAACKRSGEEEGQEDVRKGMFSATMPSSVEEMAKSVMAGAGGGCVRAIVGHKEAATTTITQALSFVNTEDHKLLSLRSLITAGQFTPPVLIFVQSIQRAKELTTELLLDGLSADCIHAERSGEERDRAVREFAEGKIWALVCTDVMGRGVDFKGVKLVINYDFPQSAMSYIHRIGRTGRAGKEGRAITFFTKADAGHLKTIVNVMRQSGCDVPTWMLALPAPSQDAKKALKMKPIGRKDVSRTNGSSGERGEKGKKRERVMGGKGGVFKSSKKGGIDVEEEGEGERKKGRGKKKNGREEADGERKAKKVKTSEVQLDE